MRGSESRRNMYKNCGHKITPRLVWSECNEPLHAKQVKPELTQDYFNYLEQYKIQS